LTLSASGPGTFPKANKALLRNGLSKQIRKSSLRLLLRSPDNVCFSKSYQPLIDQLNAEIKLYCGEAITGYFNPWITKTDYQRSTRKKVANISIIRFKGIKINSTMLGLLEEHTIRT